MALHIHAKGHVVPPFISQKDQEAPLPTFLFPSILFPSLGLTRKLRANKSLKSPRRKPLALETFEAETGGVVWSKRSREEKSTNSREESLHMEFSFAFCAVSNSPLFPHPFKG